MLTDAINIKDAFVINFQIEFQITVFKNYNKYLKYKNKYLKGRIISLLSNGGLKLETNKKIKELFFGDQII